MTKVALIFSVEILRHKIEKTLQQFGISDIQSIRDNIFMVATKELIQQGTEVVILDVDSRQYDALQIIVKLKSQRNSKNLPILAVGNGADKATIMSLLRAGCASYVTAPIDEMILASKIFQMLRDKEKIGDFIRASDQSVSNADLIKLNLFVKDWLIRHIYLEDKKIADFIK